MKKGIFYMLLIALILSYFDGVMTFIWIKTGCVYEVGPINSFIQKIVSLNHWLIIHTLLGIITALVILRGKYETVVKCWLVIEILIATLHLITLKLYLL